MLEKIQNQKNLVSIQVQVFILHYLRDSQELHRAVLQTSYGWRAIVTHPWPNPLLERFKGLHFFMGISSKMTVIARLEIELAYNDLIVQYVSHYVTDTPLEDDGHKCRNLDFEFENV